MSQTYFSKFNAISYKNNLAVDITERAIVLNKVINNPYIYYPLDISQGIRPDQVSQNNFNDPFLSWVLYLTNDIVDPYYDWYLTEEEFNKFIISKYGSIENAMEKVLFYRTNNYNNDTLSISAYEDALPEVKKYFVPNYNNGRNIINYVRNDLELTTTTNYTFELVLSNNQLTGTVSTTKGSNVVVGNNTTFLGGLVDNEPTVPIVIYPGSIISINGEHHEIATITDDLTLTIKDTWAANNKNANAFFTLKKDEIIFIAYDLLNKPLSTGKAQVVFANSNVAVCQHGFNDAITDANNGIVITANSFVYGKESRANCQILECANVDYIIPLTEEVYWERVYYYDYEKLKNEGNKTIRVLQPQFVPTFVNNANTLLSNTSLA